ncbi:MAG TPA: HNH endonuclease [Lentisphaeria bacterium]|nr:MAG: HNH endonuclease [Lentisphaerae bacterium GWF2_38_69]HBM16847.1 HNH endonuclease [Lentisphaeria bacterium]
MTDDWIDIQKNKSHIEREKKKAAEMRKSNWWQNLLQKGICHYCRKKFTPEELTMDHVVPLSRGGKSSRGNIVLCCKECNNNKKYLTPVELILKELEKNYNRQE